ncbi:MAG: hypothetical protein NTY19_13300 [Planctomycetota bacterium]|nr:hypothetical protein [Planctomycetota bacterium]
MRTKFTLITVPLLALAFSASRGRAEPAAAPRVFEGAPAKMKQTDRQPSRPIT